MDCLGAGPWLAHAQNPTAWGQPVGTLGAGIETIRNNGGTAKSHKAQGFSVSLPRAAGLAAVVAVGLSRFCRCSRSDPLMRSRNGGQKPNRVPEIQPSH